MTDQPEINPLHPNADKGREPQFFPGRMGTRMYSLAALLERIEESFLEEYSADQLREADTAPKRIKLILETINYVLAVESVQLSAEVKAELIRRAYSRLYGYGPLDVLFMDERVTTIALNGADRAAVRYGHGDLVDLEPIFEDEEHLRAVVERLLTDAGAELRDDLAAVETSLKIGDRLVSLNVVLPSIAFGYNVDIRVHPAKTPTLDELAEHGFMSDVALQMLRSLLASKYGFVIAGETETGKTTLLNALVNELPGESIVAVERAGELRLPEHVKRLRVQWPVGDLPGVPFSDQILAALVDGAGCILLDEVRSDEPQAIAPLLSLDDPPRQIWVVRGAPDHKRMQSALGMLARRAEVGQGETLVHALYERLPFIVTVARIREQLQLFSIAEWQSRADNDYPDYVTLMRYQEGRAQLTGNTPARWLD